MTMAVVGEIRDGKLTQETIETICRAAQLNKDLQTVVDLVLMEPRESLESPWVDRWGADRVLAYESNESDQGDMEVKLAMLAAYVEEAKPLTLFFTGSMQGQELAPRLATRTGASALVDCTAVKLDLDGQEVLATKPIYGGNAYGEYRVSFPCYLSFRAKQITVEEKKEGLIPVQWRSVENVQACASLVSRRLLRPASNDLEGKKILFVCGRGLQNAENIKRVQALASQIGAGVAGTKKTIENGWLPLETMVGQTGKILAPDLCLVLAASGATPFVHGVIGAKTIMTVNKDEEARIFEVSDLGIVDDCQSVIQIMERKFR